MLRDADRLAMATSDRPARDGFTQRAHTSVLSRRRVGWHAHRGQSPTVEPVAMTLVAPHVITDVRAPHIVVGLAAAGAGSAAWWVSGHAVAVPLTLVAVLTLLAAVVDYRVGRLPNTATGTAFAVAILSIPLVALLDDRPITTTGVGALVGVAYSGAPILFVIWLLRPNSIGGGDWKMLGSVGACVGLVLPVAALVLATIACFIQVTVGAVRRITVMPFGPSIAAALVITVSLLPILVQIFGGPYA